MSVKQQVAGLVFIIMLTLVSTVIGDCLLAGIPSRYVTKPTRSTQPSIPPGSLNLITALIVVR